MESKNGTIHQIGTCFDCGKTWQDYRRHRARKAAYSHAKETGHTVTVETGTFVTYNPKR